MRAVLFVMAACAASGCGLGRLLAPDEPISVGDETLLALAVHRETYVTLQLCRDGDYGSCMTTGRFDPGDPVHVYVVPPGRYCLLEVIVEPLTGELGSIRLEIPVEQSRCFVAERDTINYPGDVTFDPPRPTTEQYTSTRPPRWTPLPDIDARIYGRYPRLRGRPIHVTTPVPYRRDARLRSI